MNLTKITLCYKQLASHVIDMNHFSASLENFKFSQIFSFFIFRSKIKFFRFKCQSIDNFITSSARYGVPCLDCYFYFFGQITKFFGVKSVSSNFCKKSTFFDVFFYVTWPKLVSHLKYALL